MPTRRKSIAERNRTRRSVSGKFKASLGQKSQRFVIAFLLEKLTMHKPRSTTVFVCAMKIRSNSSESGSKYSAFELTRWTIIQRAGDASSPEADAALNALCEAYWQPLYYYIRRRGQNHEDAKDLTQGFFARLLEKNYLSAVDRRKGKFRSFLLASLEHFLANHWRDSRAQKRGGGVTFVSFDETFDQSFADNIADTGCDSHRVFEQQ